MGSFKWTDVANSEPGGRRSRWGNAVCRRGGGVQRGWQRPQHPPSSPPSVQRNSFSSLSSYCTSWGELAPLRRQPCTLQWGLQAPPRAPGIAADSPARAPFSPRHVFSSPHSHDYCGVDGNPDTVDDCALSTGSWVLRVRAAAGQVCLPPCRTCTSPRPLPRFTPQDPNDKWKPIPCPQPGVTFVGTQGPLPTCTSPPAAFGGGPGTVMSCACGGRAPWAVSTPDLHG